MEINKELNDVQQEIIKDTEGVFLVLAGAGSGKTRVLTYRVAYLVKEKLVPSYNILAITFTNKATNEMKTRLNNILGPNHQVFVSTFHSLCAYILRNDITSLGYARNTFTIYDETDQKRVIKRVLTTLGYDGDITEKQALREIGTAKQMGLTPDQYFLFIKGENKNAEKIYKIYSAYELQLINNNCLDFDDLLLKTKTLFENFPDILEKYQDWFRYIHVDEFQDTNPVQFRIVELLQKKHKNLFVVGDDDQGIYGWRGAEIDNILDFDKHFENVKVYKLEQNYRSTKPIIEVANNIIKNNVYRKEKTLFTEKEGGPKVIFNGLFSDKEEARWVVDRISNLKFMHGYRNSDFAILVRKSSLSRNFEDALNQYTMPYKLMGGTRFLDRAEIKDVSSYLNVLHNPQDGQSLIRALRTPSKGIGEVTINKMLDYADKYNKANNTNISLHDVIFGIDNEHSKAVTSRVTGKILEFKKMLMDMQDKMLEKDVGVDEIVDFVVKRAKFKEALLSSSAEEDISRWENIQEFIVLVRELMLNGTIVTLEDLIERLSLVPENKDELTDLDQVTIATVHAVKGLEFKVVFIVACETNIFPSALSVEEGRLEEERRLMYVATTRAKEHLLITWAGSRWDFQGIERATPSRFVLEAQNKVIIESHFAPSEEKPESILVSSENRAKQIIATVKSASQIADNDKLKKYKKGVKVKHRLYGVGEIILITGPESNPLLTIDFGELGIKKFEALLAKLDIV